MNARRVLRRAAITLLGLFMMIPLIGAKRVAGPVDGLWTPLGQSNPDRNGVVVTNRDVSDWTNYPKDALDTYQYDNPVAPSSGGSEASPEPSTSPT